MAQFHVGVKRCEYFNSEVKWGLGHQERNVLRNDDEIFLLNSVSILSVFHVLVFPFLMTCFLLQDSNSGTSNSQLWKLWYPLTLHLGCLMNFSPFEGLTNCRLVEVFFFFFNCSAFHKWKANPRCRIRTRSGAFRVAGARELDFHQHSTYSELFIWVAKQSSILSVLAVFSHAFCVSVKKLTASSSWQVFCSYARCSSVHNQSTQSLWRRQE